MLVRSLLSAISPGTETMIYRGEFPEDVPIDETIPGMDGEFSYPFQYGYSLVGEVAALGQTVSSEWLGQRVFAFHPHESSFLAKPEDLLRVPEDVSTEDAVFLPNMETAINLVMDTAPLVGERGVVFGQGIVGLLTTALLSRFPLECLLTLDAHDRRRQLSLDWGADDCLNPKSYGCTEQIHRSIDGKADFCIEVSGSPEALNQAIAVTGYGGRIIIGSWYGRKQVQLDLGGDFHRSRIRLISSQVSSIQPKLLGRWDKRRRLDLSWRMIVIVEPSTSITHRFPITRAADAYKRLDQEQEETLQIVLEYPRQ